MVTPLLPLIGAITGWTLMFVIWYCKTSGMNATTHEKWMYLALALWAVIDVAVLVSRYGFLWT